MSASQPELPEFAFQQPVFTRKLLLLGSLIWILSGCFFLYEFFIRTSMVSLESLIAHDLSINAASIAIISVAYYIAYSAMQIPMGILIDRYGVRKVLTAGVGFCALGVALFSISHSVFLASIGRFAMGIGSSAAFVSMLAISLAWFPRQYFGLLSGSTQILGIIGPILAGAPLTLAIQSAHGNWRIIMQSVAVIGLILMIIIYLIVRNQPPFKSKSKFQSNKNKNFKTTPILKSLKQLFLIRQVWWIVIYGFCIYAAVPVLGALWGEGYLLSLGFTKLSSGATLAFIWLGLGIGSPVFGFISDVMGRRKPIVIFYALTGIVSVLLLIFGHFISHWVYDLIFFLIGIAASGQTIAFVLMSEAVPKTIEATAMGLTNTGVMLGGSVGQLLMGLILFYIAKNQSHYSLSDYHLAAMFLIILFGLASLIAIFLIRETRGVQSSSGQLINIDIN